MPMEPVTLIVTALAAGAAAGATGVAKDAVKDAYNGLKKLIQDRYADAKTGVELIEQDPESDAFQTAAKEMLVNTGAAEDEAVQKAAKDVMEKAEPEKAAQGAFNIQIGGDAYGTVQGNQGDIEQTFNFGKDK